MGDDFARERAKDDLAFDPLPESEWVRAAHDGIRAAVRYSEPLSRLLRALPGAEWLAEERCWRFPFTARAAVEAVLPTIERLAAAARDDPAEEERQRRLDEAAAQARVEAGRLRNARDRIRHGGRPRPLRREFLTPAPGKPRFVLELECIDDRSPVALWGGPSQKPWVAQIFGSDGRGGFNRAFVSGAKDYSRANSKGTRGIYRFYTLEEGPIYEVNDRQTWRHTERYFARVQNGEMVRMGDEEVWSCVES